MTELFRSRVTVVAPADVHPGQAVHVNAGCVWVAATVTSVTHTRVGVDYDTHLSAAGWLAGSVSRWLVRPADGVRLRPVHALCAGDDVLAFDGTPLAVAGAWQGRDRWWVIDYRFGERARVPPAAVLRLVDPTPTVTVNGHLL
ncbi:hypothetical protein GCM10009541_53770 [Micromonospora gifhornensis]|uniref:Uncharacterized protein n=1 Tax=Micromonospora gifhornensis TaxID=84594 RepID=A0ABQ4IKH1_9ACTN|nr:hypothetical protein [Micromonospora gifhornensis]GIJ18414.1 hypothetical protein Vgi01_50980 [Micromonospora gifhornensis]